MKKIKKIAALAMAMALAAGSTVSVGAVEASKYNGTIGETDLTINMDFPADGALTLKPYGAEQISTGKLYFKNKNEASTTSGDEQVNYTVGLAGYTCVLTDADSSYPMKLVSALSTAETEDKEMKISIELATTCAVEATTDAQFKAMFTTPEAVLAVTTKSESDFIKEDDSSTYTKATSVSEVAVAPEQNLPFRITGEMNTNGNWKIGDTVSIVPVFKIGVDVTTVQ